MQLINAEYTNLASRRIAIHLDAEMANSCLLCGETGEFTLIETTLFGFTPLYASATSYANALPLCQAHASDYRGKLNRYRWLMTIAFGIGTAAMILGVNYEPLAHIFLPVGMVCILIAGIFLRLKRRAFPIKIFHYSALRLIALQFPDDESAQRFIQSNQEPSPHGQPSSARTKTVELRPFG
ncbi:MAG: hypothetical protein AAF497_06450 [Planctomycetota bacterium]